MGANSYYALVAGLTEWSLDGETKGFDIEAIRAEIDENLAKSDRREVALLYTYYDCENLVALRSGSTAHNRLGSLSEEELVEELKRPTRLPAALCRVIKAYADPESEEAEDVDLARPFAQSLFGAYYALCAKSKCRFLREWSEANRTMRNVVAALTARAAGVAIDGVTVGEGDIVDALTRSSAPDFGLRGEISWVEAVVSAINDERNMIEKERKLDAVCWDIASELSTFDYFSLDAIMAYLVKVNLVARWSMLDRKYGAEMFTRLMAELDGKDFVNKM